MAETSGERGTEVAGPQSLIYAFVAVGTEILHQHTDFVGNFADVAFQCLEKLLVGKELPIANSSFIFVSNGYEFHYLFEDGISYCVIAAESMGRQVPIAFLDRVKDDFVKGCGTAKDKTIDLKFRSKLKVHMQYCVNHPERINKMAKTKPKVSETLGDIVEDIEKILDRENKIKLIVEETEKVAEVGSTSGTEIFITDEDAVDASKDRIDKLKLFPAACYMGGYEVKVLIKKGPELKKKTYDIMKNFQHNSLIPYMHFYPEGNHGRFVIPSIVEVSFESWLDGEGHKLLIDSDGNMTPLFKAITIDICDVVEKLYKENIRIMNLTSENLYIAKEVSPRILLLISEAELLETSVSKIEIWEPVKKLIEWCCNKCNAKLNPRSTRFIEFIGKKKFSVKSLKKYPDDWNHITKHEYLLSLISARTKNIKSALKDSDIVWPKINEKIPSLLEKIIEEQRVKGRNYIPPCPYDYVNLIRDVYKHYFTFSSLIQNQCGSPQGFIQLVEKWSPDIWANLFDAIGWP